MNWKLISLLLCVFGFLKEFKPSDPFVFEYLTGPSKNFTREQVYQEVIPVATYSNLSTLLLVLLLTDFLRYKPVIILCGLSGCCSQITMILFKSLWAMKVVYFFNGLASSTEVAYFTYLYAKVDKKHYQEVASHTNIALLLGRFVAGVTAQFLISFALLNYQQLYYLTLSGLVFGTIWTFFLPSVNQTVYLHRTTVSNTDKTVPPKVGCELVKLKRSTDQLDYFQSAVDPGNKSTNPTLSIKVKNVFHILWNDFLLAYSQGYVLMWSAWCVFAYCGWMQVLDYIQVLWQTSFTNADNVFNGAPEASYTILSALATFGVGKLGVNWSEITEAFLAIFISIQGILLLVAAKTYNIWLSYAAYVGFRVVFQIVVAVANSEIAKNVPENSFALIVGINTLIGLILQSILTFTVTESWGFALDIRSQFVVYGSYHIIMAAAFATMAIYRIMTQCRSNKRVHLWE